MVARAVELADAFHHHDAPVVPVRLTADADGSAAAPGRTEIPRPPGPLPSGCDAFYGTDLDLQLRRRGATQLVLAGIATSIGVESTARAAYEHGYNVTLVTDAIADRDAEAHHHSVKRIFPLLGEGGSTAEIVDLPAKTRA